MFFVYIYISCGQIIATSHDLGPQKLAKWQGNPLISGKSLISRKSRLVKYYNLARIIRYLHIYIYSPLLYHLNDFRFPWWDVREFSHLLLCQIRPFWGFSRPTCPSCGEGAIFRYLPWRFGRWNMTLRGIRLCLFWGVPGWKNTFLVRKQSRWKWKLEWRWCCSGEGFLLRNIFVWTQRVENLCLILYCI